MDKVFAIHSFGCKVNQEDGRAVASLFLADGWRECNIYDAAGLYIINTCTVTQIAERKARAMIRRLRREHPQALLAVCGCYAQVAPEQLAAMPELDIVAGVEERAQLPLLVEQRIAEGQFAALSFVHQHQKQQPFTLIAAAAEQKRARAYLKIEDGCEEFCNYCIVPFARGPVRSLPLQQAVAQAAALVEQGHKEVVISGIHIGAYGRDLQDGSNLPALTTELAALPGLVRIRLGSIEPQQFTQPILDMLASEKKICSQLHIPLQAGSDNTLQQMARKYDTAYYAQLLQKLREIRADFAITTDIMVGHPGETADDFADSMEFCRCMGFAKMHVFPYSPRPGTIAATMPNQVNLAEKKRRAALMGELAEQLAANYAEGFIGKPLDLLPERIIELDGVNYITGHSDNYIPLAVKADNEGIMPAKPLIKVVGCSYRNEYLFTRRIDMQK